MIELRNITLGYGARTLVEGASATFARGELSALLGRNGTGKSTLLRAVAGLAHPTHGTIMLDGRAVSSLPPKEAAALAAFVSTDVVRVQNLRAYDAVALGRAPYTGWFGRLTPADHDAAARALALVGMQEFASKGLDTLSDGERQRVMIARALAQDTPIILLDEPTAFLDLPNRYEIFALLRRLAHDEGKTIICSTHDLGIALGACDTLAMIDNRHLMHGPVAEIDTKVREILGPDACR